MLTKSMDYPITPGRRLFLLTLFLGGLLAGCGSSANKANVDKTDGATADKPVAADSAAGTNESAAAGPVRVSLTQSQYDVAAIKLAQPTARTLSTTLKVNGTLDVPAQNLISVSVPFGAIFGKSGWSRGCGFAKASH